MSILLCNGQMQLTLGQNYARNYAIGHVYSRSFGFYNINSFWYDVPYIMQNLSFTISIKVFNAKKLQICSYVWLVIRCL